MNNHLADLSRLLDNRLSQKGGESAEGFYELSTMFGFSAIVVSSEKDSVKKTIVLSHETQHLNNKSQQSVVSSMDRINISPEGIPKELQKMRDRFGKETNDNCGQAEYSAKDEILSSATSLEIIEEYYAKYGITPGLNGDYLLDAAEYLKNNLKEALSSEKGEYYQ